MKFVKEGIIWILTGKNGIAERTHTGRKDVGTMVVGNGAMEFRVREEST